MTYNPFFSKLSGTIVSVTLEENSSYDTLDGKVISIDETDAGDFLILDCGSEEENDTFGIFYIRCSKIVCIEELSEDD